MHMLSLRIEGICTFAAGPVQSQAVFYKALVYIVQELVFLSAHISICTPHKKRVCAAAGLLSETYD
jgi:hypothetical protein